MLAAELSTIADDAPRSPAVRSSRHVRRVGFALVALVGSALLGIVGFELLCQLCHLGPDILHRPDPLVGHALIADTTGWFESPTDGGARWVTTSTAGLRDHEYPLAKPPGIERVLILGDSYPEGLQVELTETFQDLVERRLNERRGSTPVQVINGGVSGYGTDNELLFYRHVGRNYRPDVVVLCFFMNDLEDNSRSLQERIGQVEAEPYFTLETGQLAVHDYPYVPRNRLHPLLNRYVRSYRAVARRVELLLRAQQIERAHGGLPGQFPIHLAEYDADLEAAWDLTKALIRQVRDEVEADGARFLLLIQTCGWQVHPDQLAWFEQRYPALAEHRWDWSRPNRMLQEFAQQEGFPVLDLLPAFQTHAAKSTQPLHNLGGHWTPAGHALAAETLFPVLVEQLSSP